MSKKDFKGGLNSLFGNEEQKSDKDSTNSQGKEITKSSQKGTKQNEIRATFIVDEGKLEKLKAVAYWDRLKIKEVVSNALNEYLENYEKKNGEIKSIPKK